MLSKLRDQYIYAQDTTYEDVMSGMAEFYLDQVKYTSIDFKPTRKIQWPFLQGKGGFYFEIMYGDVTDWDGRVSKPDKSGNRKPISFSYFCLCNVTTMAKWLTLSRPVPFNEEYLLAHEYPFHLWCQIASRNDWYGKDCLRPDYQMNIAWALDQIRQYSLTMDEDSYRGRFTAKLLQHFNEGSVDPDFRSLWNSVLSGQYALRKPHGW